MSPTHFNISELLLPANEVSGKVMFLHLSVCSQGEGGLSTGGGLHRGKGSAYRASLHPERGGDLPIGGLHPEREVGGLPTGGSASRGSAHQTP